jgi:hypothetical protein
MLVESIEVWHVKRMMTKKCTLRVESQSRRRKFYLHFSKDIELYDWLEEIYSRCPGSGVVDYDTFSHDLHIREPDEAGNITGFPRALAEYVDMHSTRSSVASGSSPPPPLDYSELGMSSSESAPIITPKSTLPGAGVGIAEGEGSLISIPRVDLPVDHIGFAPGSRMRPPILEIQRMAVLPKRGGGRTPPPEPPSPIHLQHPNGPGGRASVVHVRELTRSIKYISRYPVATGGFSDVYQG